ncbi:hypothetical protein Q75_00810 [Bacillus coahuilensis p1.1.43]|uniref:STAS domain-containing protein n=1 Tax=Bacillus coahuilensis p1.1.43 TaxID=1150625 RepID=A0A147KCD8_9BACI|nr:hypothetical protein Q75_00810 [Bacillus coahuilensis p1.1.43]
MSFFKRNTDEIILSWFGQREEDSFSIFNLHAPTHVEKLLREESSSFIQYITKEIVGNDSALSKELEEWSQLIAKNRVDDGTSIEKVMEQFAIFRGIYSRYLTVFISENRPIFDDGELFSIIDKYHFIFDKIIQTFVVSYQTYYEGRLDTQRGLINELSAPVIILTKGIGILPLIGDIDTSRAKYILEYSLQQCMDKGIEHLVLDLSAVPIVDTMVAQKLFSLVETLKLIGVETIVTGIKPTIAQTAVHLGLDFNTINVQSTLATALKNLGYTIQGKS